MFAPEPGCGARRPSQRGDARQGIVAIVTAMPEELEAVARCISKKQRRRGGKRDRGFFLEGKIGGASVVVGLTGDGAVRASRSLESVFEEFPVSFLVGAGAAGALVPSLRAGDLVVADRVVDVHGEAPAPDAGWLARAVAAGARPATVVTLAKLICSSKEKKDLAARFGASDSGPAVVDTESAAWVRAAASRGVPCLILRAVSDTFEDELPGFLSSCLSADGSVNRAAVARRLLLHPGALPVLLRARERVREGAARVGLFLEKLLLEKI
jgi:adenosylhomocysteine nucleosidase